MSNSIKNLVGVLSETARLVMGFMAGTVGFLAGSIQTGQDDDEAGDPMQGGVLNYRTGKLDDGTDPYGWYERE